MRLLVIQMNPIIGDLEGNSLKIIEAIERGRQAKVDLLLFPELALTGYPPEDLLLLPAFLDGLERALKKIIAASAGIALIVGLPRRHSLSLEKPLYNSAAIIHDGRLVDYVDKLLLPNYDVFDERRFFSPGKEVKIWEFKGERIAITLCEDVWKKSGMSEGIAYERNPLEELALLSPTCMLNLTASPYSRRKGEKRNKVFAEASLLLKAPVVMCNQVGANDSLIFDGHSLCAHRGSLIRQAKGFVEEDLLIDLSDLPSAPIESESSLDSLFQALVLGIRDYFRKLGFKKACLGLSGGIDSALVACLAVEALGPENVTALMMPSRYSAPESLNDALLLANRLKMPHHRLSIEAPFESYLTLLAPLFEEKVSDITEENLQARIRGMLLMAYSNKFHSLLLATGNKSEFAVGYSTLYGDMCGAIAPIGDLWKGEVYTLAGWINRVEEIIPAYTLQRPPSAELRFNQKDSDQLPEYAIMDRILKAYLEENESGEKIARDNHFSLEFVKTLIHKLESHEFKRRQGPLSLRVSEKSFSVGRRFPIVQKWI